MGHSIRAFIAKAQTIQEISAHWVHAEKHDLPQGYALAYLNDDLFDDIEELFDEPNTRSDPALPYLTDSVIAFLMQESRSTQIIYLETDYFGGCGTQAGVLFENGKLCAGPESGNGAINRLLRRIGVCREKHKDEFDSLMLFRFRHMDS